MSISINYIANFVSESNKIEGIIRPPTPEEITATQTFIGLPKITVPDLQLLVHAYTVKALHRGVLREQVGQDVRIGKWIAPRGGPQIRERLQAILDRLHDPWAPHLAFDIHQEYEHLHPFTDGNGRSGRALWLWQMHGVAPLGFLHHFYYQALSAGA